MVNDIGEWYNFNLSWLRQEEEKDGGSLIIITIKLILAVILMMIMLPPLVTALIITGRKKDLVYLFDWDDFPLGSEDETGWGR